VLAMWLDSELQVVQCRGWAVAGMRDSSDGGGDEET
jgi:hypothetical protein